MRYYLIAGEASGDLHASNLMAAMKQEDAEAEFRFFGGDLMQAVGGTLVRHYRELAFMGLMPVLLHLRTILRNMKFCCEDIRDFQPDVVILVDYPGFNLQVAKYVKTKLKIPVYYYISPKIWAWKKYRIKSIRRYVDRMFCILPFEVDFFKSLNYTVDYVGNPTVDSVAAFRQSAENNPDDFRHTNGLSEKPVLAILAGSRKAEIRQNLPTMLAVAERFPEFQIVIAGAPGLTTDDYSQAIGDNRDVRVVFEPESPPAQMTEKDKRKVHVVFGRTYQMLTVASYALVTSGTATLETALFRVPQVVCYYIAPGKLMSFIFKHFFHISYISLVNLIAGNEVVQELFAANFSYQKIHDAFSRIIQDETYKSQMLEGYDRVITAAGKPGAAVRAAQLIVHSLICK